MALRAEESLRYTTEDASGTGDDIDAGWDDVPESMAVPATAALSMPAPLTWRPPASSSPPNAETWRPPGSARVSPKVSGIHTLGPLPEPVLHAPRPRSSSRDEDDAPTLEVGAEFLDEAGLAALGVSLDFTAEASRESAEDFEVVKDDELLG